MKIRRSWARLFAVLSVFAMIAAACGGGDDGVAPAGEQATGDQTQTAPTTPPVATTAPIQFEDDEATEGEATDADASNGLTEDNFTMTDEGDVEEVAEPASENIVLHVKDDVRIVPAFDAPNGSDIKLYDVNAIDGVETEYPLLATTHFGNRLALRVEEYDASGAWARVQVPVRPNGTTAWVQTAFFTEERHDYRIVIDVTTNLVQVFEGDVLLIEQISVVGRESRKTPLVTAYIDEKIPGANLSPAYGTWILSIAAFSEDLGTFGGGGMPKLALHGTNQPDLMGQAVSSGCVRVPNEVVDFIADNVPVGTVVEIIA